uniref:Uncharacterized protein n=1 Tax=Octopus bimaculoides TaxID=37653 RepID=A0A0L8HYF4_OCTBM
MSLYSNNLFLLKSLMNIFAFFDLFSSFRVILLSTKNQYRFRFYFPKCLSKISSIDNKCQMKLKL